MSNKETNRSDDIAVADVADRVQQKLVRRWSVVFAFVAGGLTLFSLLEVRHLVLRAEKYAQNSLENKYAEVVLNSVVEQTGSYVPNLEKITVDIQSHDLSIIALQLRMNKLEKFIKEVPGSAAPEVQSNLQQQVDELESQLQNVEDQVTQTLKKKAPRGQGWIYVGEYDRNRKIWRRFYVEIDENKPPSQLLGRTGLRIIVDGLNVRDQMYVGDIIEVLNRESMITVDSVQSYYSTDYYWAKVTYN